MAPQTGGVGRYLPYAFTEQGVAMLSSVINGNRAIEMNIAIMRTFVQLRQILADNHALAVKFAAFERKLESHDEAIGELFSAIQQLLASPEPNTRKIGFDPQSG